MTTLHTDSRPLIIVGCERWCVGLHKIPKYCYWSNLVPIICFTKDCYKLFSEWKCFYALTVKYLTYKINTYTKFKRPRCQDALWIEWWQWIKSEFCHTWYFIMSHWQIFLVLCDPGNVQMFQLINCQMLFVFFSACHFPKHNIIHAVQILQCETQSNLFRVRFCMKQN